MVLAQQSAQSFSHVALLLWFFINQRQVFPSQLVNSSGCERLSCFIVCHWLLQSAVCPSLSVFLPHRPVQDKQANWELVGPEASPPVPPYTSAGLTDWNTVSHQWDKVEPNLNYNKIEKQNMVLIVVVIHLQICKLYSHSSSSERHEQRSAKC